MTRDLTWAAMISAGERMHERYAGEALTVRASRRRSLVRWSVIEGLEAVDNWTDVFEPIRKRRLFGSNWNEIQPVQVAASNIGAFLRKRPDLPPG